MYSESVAKRKRALNSQSVTEQTENPAKANQKVPPVLRPRKLPKINIYRIYNAVLPTHCLFKAAHAKIIQNTSGAQNCQISLRFREEFFLCQLESSDLSQKPFVAVASVTSVFLHLSDTIRPTPDHPPCFLPSNF